MEVLYHKISLKCVTNALEYSPQVLQLATFRDGLATSTEERTICRSKLAEEGQTAKGIII